MTTFNRLPKLALVYVMLEAFRVATTGKEDNANYETATLKLMNAVITVCLNRKFNQEAPIDYQKFQALVEMSISTMRMGYSNYDILNLAFKTGPDFDKLFHKNMMEGMFGMLNKWFPSHDIRNFHNETAKFYLTY